MRRDFWKDVTNNLDDEVIDKLLEMEAKVGFNKTIMWLDRKYPLPAREDGRFTSYADGLDLNG